MSLYARVPCHCSKGPLFQNSNSLKMFPFAQNPICTTVCYPENKWPLLWRPITPKRHPLPNRSTWLICVSGRHETFSSMAEVWPAIVWLAEFLKVFLLRFLSVFQMHLSLTKIPLVLECTILVSMSVQSYNVAVVQVGSKWSESFLLIAYMLPLSDEVYLNKVYVVRVCRFDTAAP